MFSAWLMRKLRLRVLRYTMPRRQDKIPANHRGTSETVLA